MKRSILIVGFIGATVLSLMANADCMDVVHEHTMAPVNEMKSLGVDADGITTVVRYKDTHYAPMGVELSKGEISTTTFQCNGHGKYRQFLTAIPSGWSVWRDGTEWNASYWETF